MVKFKKLLFVLLLPLLLTSCARAQGALAPTGVAGGGEGYLPIEQGSAQYLPDVLPASLEPIINFVMSDFRAKNSLIPLEDSVDSELTFSNLFVNDRISGYDRNESGRRVSYGFKSSFFNNLGEFDFTAGQAFIIKSIKQDVAIRGFAENNKSNIVGMASYRGKKYFSMSYSFQLDQANYRNDINQVVTNFNYKKLRMLISI